MMEEEAFKTKGKWVEFPVNQVCRGKPENRRGGHEEELLTHPAFSSTDAESHNCINTTELNNCTTDGGLLPFLSISGTARSLRFLRTSLKVSELLHMCVCVCMRAHVCATSKSLLQLHSSFPSLMVVNHSVMSHVCDVSASEELHAEVCYAECLLQRAALTFLQVRN